MKKAKLLEMIQALPDGSDILFWNPLVSDWMEISPVLTPMQLFKLKPSVEYACVVQQNKDLGTTTPPTKQEWRKTSKTDWEALHSVVDTELSMYDRKNVVVLQAKPRGRSTYDRHGQISY